MRSRTIINSRQTTPRWWRALTSQEALTIKKRGLNSPALKSRRENVRRGIPSLIICHSLRSLIGWCRWIGLGAKSGMVQLVGPTSLQLDLVALNSQVQSQKSQEKRRRGLSDSRNNRCLLQRPLMASKMSKLSKISCFKTTLSSQSI